MLKTKETNQTTKDGLPAEALKAVNAILGVYGYDISDLMPKQEAEQKETAPKYLRFDKVEELYGMNHWKVRRLIDKGEIKASKTSSAKAGSVLINRASVEDYLARCAMKSTLEAPVCAQ